MRPLKEFGLLLVQLATWTSAQAATIEVRSTKDLTVVAVEGELDFRDEEAFTDKVLRLREAVVLFDSVGGNLVAGIEIGKAIRLKGFNTLALSDKLCVSACALAWLGGKARWAAPRAKIAFHAAWMFRDGKKQETGSGNALVGAYLNTLGLTDEAIVFITSAAPDEAEFLSTDLADAKAFGIGNLAIPCDRDCQPRDLGCLKHPLSKTVESRHSHFNLAWRDGDPRKLPRRNR
jgi:hypothetical protein